MPNYKLLTPGPLDHYRHGKKRNAFRPLHLG